MRSVLPMPEVEELFHGWMGSDGLFPEAQAMLTEQPVRPPQKVRPSEEARKVYRDLVRKAHPDLARDDAERARRDAFIARVNAAYGRGDEAVLRELAAGVGGRSGAGRGAAQRERGALRAAGVAGRAQGAAGCHGRGAGGQRDRRDDQDGAGGPGRAAGRDRREAARRCRRSARRTSRSWSGSVEDPCNLVLAHGRCRRSHVGGLPPGCAGGRRVGGRARRGRAAHPDERIRRPLRRVDRGGPRGRQGAMCCAGSVGARRRSRSI